MNAVLEVLRTCLGICGCLCLDEDFWRARQPARGRGFARSGSAGTLVRPRPQAYQDVEESLLDPAEQQQQGGGDAGSAAGSVRGDRGGDDHRQLLRSVSSSSEDLYRAASFNTKVKTLRSASPFYRSQQAQLGGASAGSSGGMAGGGADIELKPTPPNMLLGQVHVEGRGKFVQAHPVLTPGASPSAAHAAGTVRRGPSPHGAVA